MKVILVPRPVAQAIGCCYLAYYGLFFGCLVFLFFATHHPSAHTLGRHHRTPTSGKIGVP